MSYCSQAVTHILTSKRIERIAGAGGRPQHAGVCDHCEAERLVVEVVATNAPLTSRASTLRSVLPAGSARQPL